MEGGGVTFLPRTNGSVGAGVINGVGDKKRRQTGVVLQLWESCRTECLSSLWGVSARLLPSIATAAFIKTVLSRKFGIVPSFGHRAAGEL